MRIAAVRRGEHKIYGALEGECFRPILSADGHEASGLPQVVELMRGEPHFADALSFDGLTLESAGGSSIEERDLRRHELSRHAHELVRSGYDSSSRQAIPDYPIFFTKGLNIVARPFQTIDAS